MVSRTSRFVRIITAAFVIAMASAVSFAQDDPDPNSPTPILLSESGSTRALAVEDNGSGSYRVTKIRSRAFEPNARIVLYLANLSLMKGEGAGAFRVYAIDKRGHQYRFPTLNLQPVTDARNVWALTTVLTDEIGYWPAPDADGDIAVFVTWRGLASNTVKLGLGEMGGGVGEIPNGVPTPVGTKIAKNRTSSENFVGYRWSSDRMRFLQQATFGPTQTLDQRLRRIGLRTWLAEQFELGNTPMPKDGLQPANIGTNPTCDGGADDVPAQCGRDAYSMYKPQTWFMKEAYYGQAQLRLRVSWALAQIWVTSGVDVQQGRHMVEFFDILNKNAFGNYKDIMTQVTKNPAMGTYLDMAISTRTNPNENYPREILQLFSTGLFVLKPDGTLQLDAQNNPIPTYDQNGVNNLTKIMTGWSLCSVPATCPNIVAGTQNYIDPMILNPGQTNINNNRHDLTAKTFTLNSWPTTNSLVIPACANCTTFPNILNYAEGSLSQTIDYVYQHQNVGPFVSKILIQHLVTSDPTPEYVGRVAAVFNSNKSNPSQMKEVIKAILLDPEARGDVKTDPMFGKLREPVQFATNVLRTLNVRGAVVGTQSDGSFGVVGFGRTNGQIGEFYGMAQAPFLPPTVFNFYPPDYVVPGTAFLGPEFALLTTGTSITRTNFVNRIVMNATPIAVAVPDFPTGTGIDITDLIPLSTADATGNLLLDELNRRMMHGQMSAAMKSTILTAVTAVSAADPTLRTRTAIYLIATSSQYQVQR
ncbi:MAG: DUF1800 family protein [Pyrinomonadaceae bacterium]